MLQKISKYNERGAQSSQLAADGPRVEPEVVDSGFAEVREDVGSRLPVALPDEIRTQVCAAVRPEVAKSVLSADTIETTMIPPIA